MIFTCNKDMLAREIAVANDILSSKNSMSMLSNVMMSLSGNTLSIKATDLKMAVETSVPVDGTKDGLALVFCDKLLGILKGLPSGDVVFSVEDGKMSIKPKSGKINFALRTMQGERYPDIDAMPDATMSVSSPDLIEMINQTISAVSDDETRYFMNGVYMDGTSFVSTDGRRLSLIDRNIGASFPGVIVGPRVLQMIQRIAPQSGNIDVAVTEKKIFFRIGNMTISSVVIDGQFPNYSRVIPESQRYTIKINRQSLLDALKRVSSMVEKSMRVIVSLTNGTMSVSSEESDHGKAIEDVDCEYQGPEMKIALNVRYLSDPLKAMSDKEYVAIKFSEPSKAVTIDPIDGSYFHIVMPMQMD